jgi:uncharacterized protein YfaQ (DUF2300 family)
MTSCSNSRRSHRSRRPSSAALWNRDRSAFGQQNEAAAQPGDLSRSASEQRVAVLQALSSGANRIEPVTSCSQNGRSRRKVRICR